MVAIIQVLPEDIRQAFPAFKDLNKYSDDQIQIMIDQARCYISANKYGILKESCRKLGLELMAAHLLSLQDRINSGNASAEGQITSSSIDSVSISLAPPPSKNMLEYWLSLTPYGQRYWILLMSHAPAGLYFGGSWQRVLR